MIIPEQRQSIMMWITGATQGGARQQQAFVSPDWAKHAIQRWQKAIEQVDGRTRPNSAGRATNSHPVPMLADEGLYFASESTFYRVLGGANLSTSRTPCKTTF